MPFPFLIVFLDGFANHHTIVSNFSLVNQPSLDKILQAEVFVHTDGQLRAAHLILIYTPLSTSFQAPKCIIKARDPRLHQISVAVPSFLTTNPIPEGIPNIALPSQRITKEEATSSQPTIKEEEEIVEVSNSEDDFEVFNWPLSPKVPAEDSSHLPLAQVSQTQWDFPISEAMAIQRKPRSTLQELLESQAGGNAPKKANQSKPPALPSVQASQPELADRKRKRDQKRKEVMDERRRSPSKEAEDQWGGG